jgi:hypothetical protein
MEYLDQFTKSWNTVEGIDRVRHCLVPLDGNRIMAIRGFETRLRPFLENIFLKKFLEKKNIFSRNSRKKIRKSKLVFFILLVF